MKTLGQTLAAPGRAEIEIDLLMAMGRKIEPLALDLQSATDAREVGARGAYLKVLEMIDVAAAARRRAGAPQQRGGRRG
jgi:hypothetical protein